MKSVRIVCVVLLVMLVAALAAPASAIGTWVSCTGKFCWTITFAPQGEMRGVLQDRTTGAAQYYRGGWRVDPGGHLCWFSPGAEQCVTYSVSGEGLMLGARHYTRVSVAGIDK